MAWSDSGARTGPHEIGLIANIAARNDDDAARRLYRKYRMELFRFGVHVLHDQGLAEEMVQETFVKFCRQARHYDASRGPNTTYLTRVRVDEVVTWDFVMVWRQGGLLVGVGCRVHAV